MKHNLKVVVASWGDPRSPATYSGVPRALFMAFGKVCADVVPFNLKLLRPWDVMGGVVAVGPSIRSVRPKVSPLWRYYPTSITHLTHRYLRRAGRTFADHLWVQFGVAGVPPCCRASVLHIERPIEAAFGELSYAEAFGLHRASPRQRASAIAGEASLIQQVSLVWTNSEYTASLFSPEHIGGTPIVSAPPGVGIQGDSESLAARDWTKRRVLFIGRSWEHKGGPTLVRALEQVRLDLPNIELVVVGCRPRRLPPWVTVRGPLSITNPGERDLLVKELCEAVLFCMPSRSESTGIVYMEAASFGLPVVMSRGQGREKLFPPSFTTTVPAEDVRALATCLKHVLSDPGRLRAAGEAAFRHAHEHYTYESLVDRLIAAAQPLMCPGCVRGES